MPSLIRSGRGFSEQGGRICALPSSRWRMVGSQWQATLTLSAPATVISGWYGRTPRATASGRTHSAEGVVIIVGLLYRPRMGDSPWQDLLILSVQAIGISGWSKPIQMVIPFGHAPMAEEVMTCVSPSFRLRMGDSP